MSNWPVIRYIRMLIEAFRYGVRLKHAEGAVGWLKSQMEGGE